MVKSANSWRKSYQAAAIRSLVTGSVGHFVDRFEVRGEDWTCTCHAAGMTQVIRSYVDGPHGQMHVRIARPQTPIATPLMCIHMSPMTGRIFEPLLAEMGEDRIAVAFDTPGFGMSDPPSGPPAIADYARDLLAGLGTLGIAGPIDLMGYHTGSMIAVAIAQLASERVRRLLMVSAPIFPDDERREFREHYRHREPEADGSHVLRRWMGFVYHHLRPGVSLSEVNDAFRDALLAGNIEWWGHHAAFNYDLAADLAEITQPVLILNTGDDLDQQTRRANGVAARSIILEVPGWGHGFIAQHTADVARLARSYLDAADSREFASVDVPASASGPRYPERVGSFPPPAAEGGSH